MQQLQQLEEQHIDSFISALIFSLVLWGYDGTQYTTTSKNPCNGDIPIQTRKPPKKEYIRIHKMGFLQGAKNA